MVDKNKMLKVQKMLRLALNNPNIHESHTALNKARELLRKYGFTVDDFLRIDSGTQTQYLPSPKTEQKREKKKFSWRFNVRSLTKHFVEIQEEKRVILQIIPDSSVVNGRNVDSVINTFHSMYDAMLNRIWNEKWKIVYKTKDYVSYRIVYKKDSITFLLIVPESYLDNVKHSVGNAWSKCAIIEYEYNEIFDPKNTACAYLELKDHFFKATLDNKQEHAPIPSLMAAGRNLMGNDKAIIDIAFVPVGKRWQRQAREARNKSRAGYEVKKKPSSLMDFAFVLGDFIADGVIEKLLGILDIFMGEGGNKDPFEIRKGEMTKFESATEQKHAHNGFDTIIRVASESEDKQRAQLTLRAIGTAFKDLSLDNEFEIKEVMHTESFLNRLEKHKTPLLRINGNILSTPECSQILQLPTADIQDKYPEIEHIENMEIEADKTVLDGGMLLGDITVKRKSQEVFMPTKHWDDFCRTMIVMGGQGQGKTSGFLSNLLIQAYLNGFGALAIDAAKKEISTEIQYAVDKGIVKKEDFVHIDAGKMKIALDWQEALLDEEDGLSRLASTAISFFKIEDSTVGQTSRFLRALIMCMKSGKMIELVEMMEDVEYLKEASKHLTGLNKKTIDTYINNTSPDKRRQLIAPIYNRLDSIMGDNYLAKCLESGDSINMVEIMCQRKIFVFDFSDEDLLQSQQDILINLLFSKIDLAMRLRKKIKGEEFQFPFFIAGDEPAKYLKSADIWEAMTVQGRKWRVGFAWAFHYFTQLPRGFQEAIKNSLPHYFFYPTSKDQWRTFQEEIAPFTLENAMKLKAFHAINYIYTKDGYLKPFIAHMTPPPSIYYKKKRGA